MSKTYSIIITTNQTKELKWLIIKNTTHATDVTDLKKVMTTLHVKPMDNAIRLLNIEATGMMLLVTT